MEACVLFSAAFAGAEMTQTTGWLTPAQRADFLQGVEAAFQERRLVTERPKHCPQRLSALHVRIAYKLAHWRCAAFPSHEQLALAAGSSTRTVGNALTLLQSLGLLSWTRRVIAIAGWRARITNAYAVGANTARKTGFSILSFRSAKFATSDAAAGLRILLGRILRAERAGTTRRQEPQADWLAQLGVSAKELEACRVATQERYRRLGLA
jgi:hypothetical protein